MTAQSPKLGQIGLIPHGHSFVSRGIEVVTRSPVHHVVVVVSDTDLVEATPNGAERNPISEYGTVIWSNFDMTDEQAVGSAQWAIDHIGTPYNWIDDAAIGIGLTFRLKSPKWIMRRLSSDKTLQCAQLGDFALTKGAGLSVFDDGRLPGAVYPGSFVPLFKQYDWWWD